MRATRYPRPGFITKLCYLLLILGVIGLAAPCVTTLFSVYGGMPDGMTLERKAAFVAASVLLITCGFYMGRGANWARILFYIAGAPIIIAVYIAANVNGSRDGADAVPAIIGSVVVVVGYCIALSLERANRFFTGRDTFFKEDDSRRGGGGGGGGRPGHFDY